jgi:hypothetical protein
MIHALNVCLLLFMAPHTRIYVLNFGMQWMALGLLIMIRGFVLGILMLLYRLMINWGGRPFDSYSSNPFADFMDGYGMINLGFCGNPYTWSNHRQGSSFD